MRRCFFAPEDSLCRYTTINASSADTVLTCCAPSQAVMTQSARNAAAGLCVCMKENGPVVKKLRAVDADAAETARDAPAAGAEAMIGNRQAGHSGRSVGFSEWR